MAQDETLFASIVDGDVADDGQGIARRLQSSARYGSFDENLSLLGGDGEIARKTAESTGRSVSRTRILVLALIALGQEVLYAVELSYAAPLLFFYTLPRRFISAVLLVSPILSVFLTPLLANLSDHSRARCGRRRPFIVLFSLLAISGALCFPRANAIGHAFGLHAGSVGVICIAVVLLTLTDFGLDSLETPSRSLMSDLLPVHQHDYGSAAQSVMASIGAIVGFALGAFDVSAVVPHLGDHVQTLFFVAACIYILAVTPTLLAGREEPLERAPAGASQGASEPGPVETLRFLLHMPSALKRLFFASACSWVGIVAFALFFTDYCGRSIYHGLPTGEAVLVARYVRGVRFGSLCLATSGIPNFLISTGLPSLMVWFSVEACFLCCMAPFGASCLVLWLMPSSGIAIAAACCFGAACAAVVTIPFFVAGLICPDDQTGQYMAVTSFSMSFAQLAVGITGGPIMDSLDSGGAYLAMAGLVSTLGGMLALTLRTLDGERIAIVRLDDKAAALAAAPAALGWRDGGADDLSEACIQ